MCSVAISPDQGGWLTGPARGDSPLSRLPSAALTTAVALLLTACGGSSPSSGKIVGAQGPASASPSSAPSSTINRPAFTFPADVKYIFEGGPTGDRVKDQILSDNEQRIK